MYTVHEGRRGSFRFIQAHGRAGMSAVALDDNWMVRISEVDLGHMDLYVVLDGDVIHRFMVTGDPKIHPHADRDCGEICIGVYPTREDEISQCIWDYFNGSGVNPFDCYRDGIFCVVDCDCCDANILSVVPVMCVDPNLIAAIATKGILNYEREGSLYRTHLSNSFGDVMDGWKIGTYHVDIGMNLCLDCLLQELDM